MNNLFTFCQRLTRITLLIFMCATLLSVVLFPFYAYAGEDGLLFDRAKRFAKSGDADLAYMNFNKILRDYPHSGHAETVMFAVAEYYFDTLQFKEAEKSFNEFIEKFPNSKAKLFAMAYLLKIAEKQKKETLLKELEKKIINFQKVSLVFRDHKEFAYLSALNHPFKAIFQINTIEFYRQGVLFAKISY